MLIRLSVKESKMF